ncbi:MAG: ribosome assembly cofactor RimP [Treponema sp.]|jgi:ribosome maturation factor RimP|nr:ribosome assembly cofactor RimP [Treponema sp.]
MKMRFTARNEAKSEVISIREPLEEILNGLGFRLIELSVSRHRGSVHVRAVIYNGSSIGTDDCSKVHRAITPRLELAFQEQDIHIEVSSPGTDRVIKDKGEFSHYLGKGIRCYRTDISDWTAGILETADEDGIGLMTKNGVIRLEFEIIAKAKLDSASG